MDPNERKKVLRMIPHGLQVVTVMGEEGGQGYTSSWVTQGSFEPPLLLMGVKGDSRCREIMKETKTFCIHFLGKDQVDVAKRFFKAPREEDGKLGGLSFTPGTETGCPVLAETLSHAECRIVHEWDGGDHSVVVAEVLDARVHREGEPLLLADTPWKYGG